jgi:hypothetical protein
MPNLEIFEGKSITWILLMALLLGIWWLAKFTRDFVANTIVKFEKQLNEQMNRSEKREDQLNQQLSKSIENNSRIVDALDKLEERFESRFDNVDSKIENLERRR